MAYSATDSHYKNFKPCVGCHRPIEVAVSMSDPAGICTPNFCDSCLRVHEMIEKEKGLYGRPKPPLPREKRTEPLVGLRVWKLVTENDRLYLRSASQSCLWPHRKALQIDIAANEGVHCIKRDIDKNTEKDSSRWVNTLLAPDLDDTVEKLFREYSADVAGEVYLWGKVVEHQIGYLAEFAYPKRLFVPEDTDVLTWMELEENYGVPVETDARFQKPKIEVMDPATGWISYRSRFRVSQPRMFSTPTVLVTPYSPPQNP